MKIFLISPVKGILPGNKYYKICERYVQKQERLGNQVHWPFRDTNQKAPPMEILSENYSAMKKSEQVAICWSENSVGSIFGLGMWIVFFKLFHKPIVIVNPKGLKRTPQKSFSNFLLDIHEKNLIQAARDYRVNARCERASIGVVIIKEGEIIVRGSNKCQAFLQEGCRRRDLPSGVQQELCGTLHAELDAVLNIRPDRDPKDRELCLSPTRPSKELIKKLFTEKEREILSGSKLIYSGHYYACDICREWLTLLGITDIKRDELYC